MPEPIDQAIRVAYLRATPDQQVEYDERAGILQYESGLPREEAELEAYNQLSWATRVLGIKR